MDIIFILIARQPQWARASAVRFHDLTHLYTVLWKSDQSVAGILPDNTQQIDIYTAGGIRSCNSSTGTGINNYTQSDMFIVLIIINHVLLVKYIK
jgi:hypothetical protein